MSELDVNALLRTAAERGDDSVADIARRSGLPYSTVWRTVAEATSPNLRTVGRLASAYGVTPAALLADDVSELETAA